MLDASATRRAAAVPVELRRPGAEGLRAVPETVVAYRIPGEVGLATRASFRFVSRRARYRSEMGLFSVDDPSGRIGSLRPGDRAYLQAALDPSRRVKVFDRSARPGTEASFDLPGGLNFGLYLIPNGSGASWDRGRSAGARIRPLLSFSAANPARFPNLRQDVRGTLGWEDIAGGGDRDFDDLVFRLRYEPGTSSNERPTVSIGSPSPNTPRNRSPVITGRVADDRGVASLRAEIRGPSGLTVVPGIAFDRVTGAFSFPTSLPADGPYAATLIATDGEGLDSLPVSVSFSLDASAPRVTLGLATESDTAPVGDDETYLDRVRLVGETEPDLEVVLVGTGLTTRADASGRFAFSDVALASLGPNPFLAHATDPAGNVGEARRTVGRVQRDTAPPPVTLTLAPESDTAPLGDDQTYLDRVRLVGETEPGLEVVLVGTGLTTRADASGRFAFSDVALASMGPAPFLARTTDPAGNAGEARRTVTRVERCGFEEGLAGWDASQVGGSGTGAGSVTAADRRAVLREGNSFGVTLERSFLVPANPTTISFEYADMNFDATDPGFINDAFEVALLGENGVSLVPTFTAGRDALFNLTEGLGPVKGTGVTIVGTNATIDISQVTPGTVARIVFRLVNNDADTQTSVAVVCVEALPPINPSVKPLAIPGVDNLVSVLPGGTSSPPTLLPTGIDAAGAPVVVALAGPPSQSAAGDSLLGADGRLTFTTTADFQRGTLFNVASDEVADELRLVPPGDARTYPFIWISNTAEGTVSRFDTRTGDEVGRYRTGAQGAALSPSRTAVTSDGSVWVANRAFDIQASLAHIALDGYVDRNGNGVMDTSTDLDGNGRIDPTEVLPWDSNNDGQPDDERILLSVAVGRSRTGSHPPQSNGVARAIAIDANDDVWVGLFNLNQYEVYDHKTGALKSIVPVQGTPYGAVIDANGVLYGATRGAFLDRIDTATLISSTVPLTGDNYGITVGPDGVVWATTYSSGQLLRYDPKGGSFDAYRSAGGEGGLRGVGVDLDANVWVASNTPDRLVKFTFAADHRTLTRTDSVVVGETPSAAVIDTDGYVWTTTYGNNDDRAWKIDPHTLSVVPGWPVRTGATPYNYSDMTGQIRLTVTERTGTWTEIIDGLRISVPWASVGVDSDSPVKTSVRLRVRASDSRDALSGQPWIEVEPDGRFTGIQGRYLQVEVGLDSSDPQQSPSIRSVEVVSVPTPTVAVDPLSQIAAGTIIVLSGQAIPARPDLPGGGRTRNFVTHVSVNGKPVDVLDAAGRFFTRVTVLPGENRLRVTASDIYGQEGTSTLTIEGTQPSTDAVDFSLLSDITASFSPEYARTSYSKVDRTLHADVAVRNAGRYPVDAPLYVAIASLTDPSVAPSGAAGLTPDGMPYYDVSTLVRGGRLGPTEATDLLGFAFRVPSEGQFRYDLRFFGLLNRPPRVTTIPEVDASAGRSYSYDVGAIDPDGEPVRFSLVTAPRGMTIDADTGSVAWSPGGGELGTHPVVVRASDPRGGFVEQQFDLTVTVAPPNRSPVFTSLPVGTAYVGNGYAYDADASDPDGDSLSFSLVSAPEGASIEAATGRISWTPSSAQVGDGRIVVQVSDGRGGIAIQEYPLCIMADPSNHAPVIVSQPSTTLSLSPGAAVPVDLRAWTPVTFQDGRDPNSFGEWSIDTTNTIATQLANNDKGSALLSDFSLTDYRIDGIIRVDSDADDDNIGLVFGYQDETRHYVFQWRNNRDGQLPNPFMYVGAVEPTSGDLAYGRALFSNTIPWQPLTDYHVTLDFHPGSFTITVRQGATTLATIPINDSTYTSGKFGFYCISQDHSQFRDFTVQPLANGHYAYDVRAVDDDGDPLAYSLVQGPSGMTIDQSTGLISWVVTETGAIKSLNISNTGVSDSGVRLGIGAIDPHWSVVSGPGIDSPQPAFASNSDVSYVQSNASQWIWVNPGAQAQTRAYYTFRLPIDLTGYDPSTAVVTGRWAIDDYGSISLNGLHDGIGTGELSLPGVNSDHFGRFHAFKLNHGFVDGINYLDVLTLDDGIVAGLNVSDLSISARRVTASYPVTVHVGDGRGGFDEQSFVVGTSEDGGEIQGIAWDDLNGNGIRDGFSYFQDFEDPASPLVEWSSRQVEATPIGARHFLGEFAKQDVTLTLNDLPAHDAMTVDFDLFITRSWDGNGNGEAPDVWKLDVLGGSTLFQTTFAQNTAAGQSYPDAYPGGNHPGRTGAIEQDTLGFSYSGSHFVPVWDSVYHVSIPFSHSGSMLQLRFSSLGPDTNDILNESWGLDNVRVVVASEPVLPGWSVYLDENRNGHPDEGEPPTTTDATGSYSFTGLVPGTYVVAEEPKPGWRQTAPGPGMYEVTISGPDNIITGRDFGNQQITDRSNRDPSFARRPLDTVTAGQLYRDTPPASDPDGDPLAFDLPVAPPGMTIHPTLGVLVWTPTGDQVGTHQVVLRVQDGRGGVALQSFTIDVTAPNLPPAVTSTPPGPAKVGSPYEYRIRAQDPEGDALGFRLVTGPANLIIDPITGVVSFVPTSAQVGVVPVTVEVAGGSGDKTSYSFSILVATDPVNAPPVIGTTPKAEAWQGTLYYYPVEATDADGDPLTYRLVKGPDGMTINTNVVDGATLTFPGLLRWQPSTADIGRSFEVEVAVADGRGVDAVQAFAIQVGAQGANRAPRIVSTPGLAATEGGDYLYRLKAADPDGDPVRWRLVGGPRGMSIDPEAGTLHWRPGDDQLGPNTVVVEVSDPSLATATQSFAVLVACENQAPQIASRPPTEAWNGEPYVYAVRADDPEGDPLTFRLLARPDGMTIDSATGLVRWNPGLAQPTTARVVVEVSDGQGNAATQVYDLLAKAAPRNRPPLITSRPRVSATADALYSYDVTAVDPEGEPLRFELAAKPVDAMSIDPTSGRITWSPGVLDIGSHVIAVAAIDPGGAKALQTYVLRVSLNEAPSLEAIPDQSVDAGAAHRYDVHASDPNGDALAYSLSGAPDGMSIDGLGRILWQTPAAYPGPNPLRFTVTASDPLGLASSRTYSLAVRPDAEAPRVRVDISGSPVDRGTTVRFRVRATDNVRVAALGLTLDGRPIALDAGGFASRLMDVSGLFRLVGSATDAVGNVGTSEPVEVRVFAPGDDSWPEVVIASPNPANPETTITYLTDVIGSVRDDNLVFWRLEYARVDRVDLDHLIPEGSDGSDDPNFTLIAGGTQNLQDSSLGTFDPTLLLNGPYVLRLIAGDVNGHVTAAGAVVNVDGSAKIGNFHLEFTDLQVPLVGIPIAVTRVYDTMQANDEGDFGFGWKLGLRDAQILETVAPEGDFVPGKTKVYLTNPEGRRVGFTFQQRFVSGFPGFGGVFDPYFVPDPGVYDSLDVPGLVGRGGAAGALEGAYNPDNYILTTKAGVVYSYDQSEGLQRIDEPNGNFVTFTGEGIFHSGGSSVRFVRDYRGRIRELDQFDEDGQPVGTPVRYTYDAAGDLKTATSPVGVTTRFDYLARPSAHFLDSAYDLSRQDPANPAEPLRTLKVVYQDNRFVRVIDALGNTVDRRNYDLEGRTAIVRDGNGNATTLLYDARGNVLEETDALGNRTIREYADPRNPDLETKVTDKLGFVTRRSHDDRGNLTETREVGTAAAPFAVPIVTSFAYNSRGDVRTITNALGQTTSFVYDAAGNLTAITNAQGNSSGFTYDAEGRLTTFTDLNGNTTAFGYEVACPCGAPTKILFADGTYEELDHNDLAQTTREAYFEADGTLAEITTTAYDNLGRVIEQARGQGADRVVTSRFYKGNLLDYEVVVNPLSLASDGRLLESRATPVALRKSRITAYDYDANGRLIRQVNPDGGVVQFRYDGQGNRTLLEDPVGNVTTWAYDPLNRVSEERDPFYWQAFTSGRAPGAIDLDAILAANRLPSGADIARNLGAPHVTVHGYDTAGNENEVIDRVGRRREFDHDQAGRSTAERWYDETTGGLIRTMTWTYDVAGNLMAAADPDSHYTYTYDTLSRVKTVDNAGTPGAPRVVLTYGYDTQGNVTSTSDDSGVTVGSTYDDRNRLAVRTWSGGTVDPVRIEFAYNAASRQKLLERFASLDRSATAGRTVTTYLTDGLVDTLTHRNAVDAVLAGYDYGYDFGGLVISEDRDHQDRQYRQTIEYGYDLVGQLIRADFDTQPDESYTYDLNGNRRRSEDGFGVRLYQTGPANQLESDGRYRFEYDGEGNLFRKTDITTGAVTTYAYDHRNRLVSASERDAVATPRAEIRFVYDVNGRRISEVNGTEALHTANNGDNAWADSDATGAVVHYLFGNGIDELLASQQEGEAVVFHLTDRLGSVRELVNVLGEMITHTEMASFGGLLTPVLDTLAARFAFTSREVLDGSNLYNFRARVYDPSIGRFLSQDPKGLRLHEVNLLRYSNNNPANYRDPHGTDLIGNIITIVPVTAAAGALAPCLDLRCTAGEAATGAATGVFLGLGLAVALNLVAIEATFAITLLSSTLGIITSQFIPPEVEALIVQKLNEVGLGFLPPKLLAAAVRFILKKAVLLGP